MSEISAESACVHTHAYKYTHTLTQTRCPNSEWYSFRSMGLPVPAKAGTAKHEYTWLAMAS